MRILPVLLVVSCFGGLRAQAAEAAKPVEGYHEFNYKTDKAGAKDWVQAITVSEPALRSEVSGDVTVKFQAKGMTTASAHSWQQPTEADKNPWGHDEKIGDITLDADGNGTFVFPADKFPNGPVNVRIYASNEAGKKDVFELQLFNTGGTVWNQGIPKDPPPAAKGLKLIFEDDFAGPVKISNDGRGATYNAHKPGGGDFSGWIFSDVLGEGKPFEQKGTWLRIAARKDADSPTGRSGILASVDRDFKGVWAKAPAYLECRFTAQSAIGTWPAFWTLAFGDKVTDELDIVEAYGGMGPGNPNHPGYSLVSHFWAQKNPDGTARKAYSARPDIMNLGGKSYWSTTFHTYAVYVGLEETVYYFDDIEVKRHPTNHVSRDNPHYFLINLAIGGISGWPIDLARYGEGTDMWIDYVRVYAKEPVDPNYSPDLQPKPDIATSGIGLSFEAPGNGSTEMMPKDAGGAPGVSQTNWNNLEGPKGNLDKIVNNTGNEVSGLTATWTVPGEAPKPAAQKSNPFDFKMSNLVLMSGFLPGAGTLAVEGVPYKKYDVHVYMGAEFEGGKGSVTLSPKDGAKATAFYRMKHLKGKYVVSEATTRDAATDSNFVVFRGNSAPAFEIAWDGTLEGKTSGVTAVQIVEVQ